jgi:hypothetical protein
MQDTDFAKLDQETRRHFAGIQQGIVDALHIYMCAEQMFTMNRVTHKTPQGQEAWKELAVRLLAALDLLQDVIDTGDEPISMTWWQFGNNLQVERDLLRERLDMLRSEL